MPSIEAMAEYVFENKHTNAFIKHFNKPTVSGLDSDKLRLENIPPHIYMIVVNRPTILINGKKLFLMKVGFTQISVAKASNNRMEEVRDKIKRNLKTEYKFPDDNKPKVAILFKFLIHALDTRPFYDIEKWVREKVGFPLPKENAKEWCLPVSTEWVLTTQEYIDKIKKKVEDLKDKKKVISTEIFKSEQKDNQSCNLLDTLKMTEAELEDKLKKLPFPLEKAPKETTTTPEESSLAGKSLTPEADTTKTPRETSKSASKQEAKGRGKKT